MTFKTTVEALKALMDAYDLTRGDVCRILGIKPRPNGGSAGTVDDWLCGRRGMPRAKLELVALKAPNYVRPASAPKRKPRKALASVSSAN